MTTVFAAAATVVAAMLAAIDQTDAMMDAVAGLVLGASFFAVVSDGL
jgi:hypothetical protein